MPETLFPLQCLAIAGLLAFAVHRGTTFPLMLTLMYSAFFYFSFLIRDVNLSDESQIVFGSIFSSVLFSIAVNSKRSAFIDLFCCLMILAIINYIILYISYIALSGAAYIIATDFYTWLSVMLSVADALVLIGVINGTRSDRVYKGLGRFIYDGLSSVFAFMEAPQTYDWPQRSTQIQKRARIDV